MADAVTSQTLIDQDRVAIMKFTNISDGTGESAVLKVDVSALSAPAGKVCSGVSIVRIYASTEGMGVDVLWDATTDVVAITLGPNQFYEYGFDDFGGIWNNSGAGKTGDIRFTTIGASSGDRYTIILYMTKQYTQL
jgi:hypothetical protein